MLEILCLMVEHIKSQISFVRASVDVIVERLAIEERFKSLTFIQSCKAMEIEGMPFPEAWEKSVESESHVMGLKSSDSNILSGLSKVIGVLDEEGQIAGLNFSKEMFEDRLKEARESYKKYGKMYRTLGLLSGIFLAIIFA